MLNFTKSKLNDQSTYWEMRKTGGHFVDVSTASQSATHSALKTLQKATEITAYSQWFIGKQTWNVEIILN